LFFFLFIPSSRRLAIRVSFAPHILFIGKIYIEKELQTKRKSREV